MTWATYGEFLAFASVVVLIPGPDFTVVTKNTLAAHRARRLLLRREVRRGMDGVTGALLLGFSARLAAEHA